MPKSDSVSAPEGAGRPDLKVDYRDPRELKPDPRNARTHSETQVRQIRASMDRFGFTNAILLREDDTIGAGHGRWSAALLEPVLARVPTITVPGLTEAEWRAYVIADNKLALNGGWDEDLLAEEVERIMAEGADLGDLLGFDPTELADILGQASEAVAELSQQREPAEPRFTYHEQFGVIVICAGEAEQQKAFEALTAQGYTCKVVVT